MSGAVGVGVGALGGLLGLELCLGLLGVSWGWVLWEWIRVWGSWGCVWGSWGCVWGVLKGAGPLFYSNVIYIYVISNV